MKFLLIFLTLIFYFTTEANTTHSLRICAVGDVGMDTIEQAEVAQAMLRNNCQRLVLLGDIVYPKGIQNADDPILENTFFKHYKNFKHITILLGNHDYQGNPYAWQDLARKYSYIKHPEEYFEEFFDGICLVYLDTNFSNELFKTVSEMFWLLKDRSHCRLKIAFAHHPYKSSGPKHGDAAGFTKFLLEYFVIGKFDYFISGHEHTLKDEGVVNGTRLIISGAGGKPLKGPPGYMLLDLNLLKPEKSSYKLRSL